MRQASGHTMDTHSSSKNIAPFRQPMGSHEWVRICLQKCILLLPTEKKKQTCCCCCLFNFALYPSSCITLVSRADTQFRGGGWRRGRPARVRMCGTMHAFEKLVTRHVYVLSFHFCLHSIHKRWKGIPFWHIHGGMTVWYNTKLPQIAWSQVLQIFCQKWKLFPPAAFTLWVQGWRFGFDETWRLNSCWMQLGCFSILCTFPCGGA